MTLTFKFKSPNRKIGAFELMAKAGFGPVFRHQGDRVFIAGARARGLGLALLVKSALLGAMVFD